MGYILWVKRRECAKFRNVNQICKCFFSLHRGKVGLEKVRKLHIVLCKKKVVVVVAPAPAAAMLVGPQRESHFGVL